MPDAAVPPRPQGGNAGNAPKNEHRHSRWGARATPPAPPQAAPSPPAGQLSAFVDACDRGIEQWQTGQVDYPHDLTLALNESVTYLAAVDIRNTPQAPELVIPGGSARSSPISVQCVLSARLSSVGGGLEVADQDWNMREFTPTGLVNWSWSVKALQPRDHELRLELQPTIQLYAPEADPATLSLRERPLRVTTFVTTVHVSTTPVQRAGQWWKDNWPPALLIVAGLGTAALGVVKWGGSLGESLHDTAEKWRGRNPRDLPVIPQQRTARRSSKAQKRSSRR